MTRSWIQGRSGGWWLAVVLLAGLGVRVFFFAMGLAHLPISTDESITGLQAREILRGHWPLLFMGQPYLFPVESYLQAPLAAWMPANAFGARYLAFLLGVMSTGLGVLILRRLGGWAATWPGLLLLMLPSTYVLMLTAAYALPGYSTSIFLSTLGIYSILRFRWDDPPRLYWLALAGFSVGLAFSAHMLTLPALVVVVAALAVSIRWSQVVAGGLLFGGSLLVGLLPHYLARWLIEHAHREVSGIYPWQDALVRFWPVVMKKTLPSTMGLTPTLAPDSETLTFFASWVGPFALMWMGILALTSWVAFKGLIGWIRRRDEPLFVPAMIFAGLMGTSVLVFMFSRRAGPGDYRYLILTTWCFPFALAVLGQYFRHAGARIALGGLAVVLVGINLIAGWKVVSVWRQEERMARVTLRPPVEPVIECLKERGIHHAVSSYGTAYRLTFLSDEDILCTQPINERFPGWPLPYRDVVHAATKVAYVLGEHHRFMTPREFEADLELMGVSATVVTCGAYQVYFDFQSVSAKSAPVTGNLLDQPMRATASHHPAAAGQLVDGRPDHWRCDGYLQQTGMWVAVEWDEPRSLQRISLDHGESRWDYADRVHVDLLLEEGWTRVIEDISSHPSPFKLINQHPVYGHYVTDLVLPPDRRARGVRVEISDPRSKNAWTLSELVVVTN